MKKFLIPLSMIICTLLLNVFFVFLGSTKVNLNSWIGNYSYTECFPTNPEMPSYPSVPCIEYTISIYKDSSAIYAEIINQGYQTSTHAYAKVVGDNHKIYFIFEDYLENNIFKNFHKGDLLLSFNLSNNRLYTTWHEMKSELTIKDNQTTGIFYQKTI